VVQASLGRKQDIIFKIIIAKRAGNMAEVLQSLPSKRKALGSNSSTTKKKKIVLKDPMVLYLLNLHMKQKKGKFSKGSFAEAHNTLLPPMSVKATIRKKPLKDGHTWSPWRCPVQKG
jgi:hypothetical protein